MKIIEKYSWLFSFCVALAISGRYFHCPVIYVISAGIFLTGLMIPIVLKVISLTWRTCMEIVGKVLSVILLSVLFFVLITPLSFLKKLAGKNKKQQLASNFIEKERVFSKTEFEKTW